MQQRRGNRVDLPQPLRPGEIGLASDSKEVFIGLDPSIGVTKQNANGVNINNIVGGYSYAESYLNNNIIRLILPSKRLSGFNSNSSVYTPESASNQTHNQTVFRTGLTIANVFDGEAFQSTDVTVTKNGSLLTTNSTRSTANLLTNEYLLSADSTSGTANHTITFGTPASGSDDYTVSYYDNADVIAALVDSGNIGTTDVQGFYHQYFVGTNIPDRRKLTNAYILADHVTGTAFIGLEDKHLEVVAYSGAVSNPDNLSLSGTLSVTRSAGTNLSLALGSITSLTGLVTAINNAASSSWLKAGQEDGVTDKWYLYSTDGSDFTVVSEDSNSTLNIALSSYTKASDSIKGKLESWVHGAVASTSFNMFTAAQIKGTRFDSTANNIGNYANVDASSDLLSITFTGNKEAENFSYIANRLYFANANADVTGLTNIKSNQRLLTLDDYDVLLSGSADAAYTAQSVTVGAGASNVTIDTFDSTVYDSAILEYSVKSAGTGTDIYSRTGTLHVTGDADLDDAAVADSGVVLENNFTGALTLTATMDNDIISVVASNGLQSTTGGSTSRPAVVKFITRKWLG